jgi:DNA modification methylase
MTKKFIPQQKNANRHTLHGLRLLEKSIQADGFIDAQTAAADGEIISGSARLELSADKFADVEPIIVESDGSRPVVVIRTDIPNAEDPRARRLSIAANQIGATDWNPDGELLKEWGGEDEAIRAMFADSEWREATGEEKPTKDAEPQVDRAAELLEKWQVKPGDLWQIGEHRLICGDCTDAAVVARVMDNTRAQMCFTSPPYNAGVSAQLSGNTSIDDNLYKDEYDDNQTEANYLDLLRGFTDLALSHCGYVFTNIQVLSGNKHAFLDYWHSYSAQFCDVAVWDKSHAAPQQALRVMDSRFEFVLILGGNGSRAIGTREFRGMVHNVYTGSPQRHNENADLHAATFPLDLPEHFIKTFTNEGEAVYEPFCGTGTTILACENLGRHARAVELSPAYVAVSLERLSVAFPGIDIRRLA